jgi:hypothetical protein
MYGLANGNDWGTSGLSITQQNTTNTAESRRIHYSAIFTRDGNWFFAPWALVLGIPQSVRNIDTEIQVR